MSASAQQQAQAPPAPTFQSDVSLVTSDVTVRDRRGQFQANLTKDDFEVYEDGIKQSVTSFVLVHGGRVYQAPASAVGASVREGILLPQARPVNDASGRIIIFVIDDLHLNTRDTPRLRQLFREMAKELVHDGDLFGIVSTGTSSIAPFAATRAANSEPLFNQGTQFNHAELIGRLAELTRQANRANATVYTFDPRGLVAGQDIDETVDPVEWAHHVRKTQDSLRVIADQTGGFAVVNTNNFSKAMKQIDAETSDYYVLGYSSTNPDPTQRRRVIEIRLKTKDADLDLRYRKEYTLKPAARR